MKKYKVEFIQKEIFVVDVLAEDKIEAEIKAGVEFDKITDNNTEHYYQIGDKEMYIEMIYDVTDTDDPFNPEQ